MKVIRIEMKTEDARFFVEKPYMKCYYILDTCIIYARLGFLPIIRDIIRNHELSCKMEYKCSKNIYLDVYDEGYLVSSNSLTHISKREHLEEYLMDTSSAFNVNELLMVTATKVDEEEEYYPF